MARWEQGSGTVICIAGDDIEIGQAVVMDRTRSGPPKVKPVCIPSVVSGSFKVKLTAVSATPPAVLYEALTGQPMSDRDVLVNGAPMRAHKVGDIFEKALEK